MKGEVFYIPLETAITPANGEAIVNHWWTVHPQKGVAFYAQLFGYTRSEEPSPQCNQSEHTARNLQQKIYPDCETQHIPVVFMQHAIREMNRLRKERHPSSLGSEVH